MVCNVTGTAISPNGAIKPGARITFRRAQLDVVSQVGSFVIPDDYIIQTALNGTVNFNILPGVYDATTVAVGGRTVAFRVSVPNEPAADFADLLNASYVEIPPASVTQAQQARDAAIAARDVAVAARDEALLYDGPKVDTFAELASVTTTQLAVNEYIRVIATGAVYQRVSTGGDLDYSGTGGVRLNVMPVGGVLLLDAFGDPGDGTSDFSSSIQKALDAAASRGIATVQASSRRYGVGATINWPQGATVRLVGAGYRLLPLALPVDQTRGGTWFRRTASVVMFNMTGVSLLSGGPLLHRPHVSGIVFDGAGLSQPLVAAHSCTELIADDCCFVGVSGVGIDALELFDSRFTNCRFTEMGTAAGSGAIALRSGFDSRETTNQIHFTGCVWENFPGPAITARKNGAGSIDVNEIYFTSCKMETATGKTAIVDFENVSGVHFNLLQLALRGSVGDTVSSLMKMTDCLNITGVLHVELYGPTGATLTNHVQFLGATRQADLTVMDYGERDVASGYSLASDQVTPSINYRYINRGKPTIGQVWTEFLTVDGRGRLDGEAASPRLALTRSDLASETWDIGNITADGAGSKWAILHNGVEVMRINNDNTLTNLFAMVLAASVNVNGNRLSNVSALSRFAWTTLTSAADATLACGNTDMIIADIAGGATITDITSTLSGLPIINIRNVNASPITFTHNAAKLRCMGGTNKTLNQHEAISFAFVGGVIWQQMGGKQ